jgi:preprotein translocase subunit SecA
MIDKIFSLIFGTKHERDIKAMKPLVAQINSLEDEVKALSNDEMKNRSFELRKRVKDGASLDSILPEAFALVRETGRRTMGMRHFDVQMMGGIVLHQGKIAEMKTGEGKTLVATLAVYLNGLSGKGAHVVTVNDYLARRDAEWMSKIYNFLGLTVGIIQNDMDHEERKDAYNCDITYGTNNEFGFDYLRDNMVEHKSLKVQRPLNFAIVDEVDSILIDEARTPLIISGSIEESTKRYFQVNKLIPNLIEGTDYEVSEKDKTSMLTEEGVRHVEKLMKIDNLYDNKHIEIVHYVNQALKAHTLFRRDIDYIVKDGEVQIVDEFTGRLMAGRRYSDGLHQALEAKEGVTIARESQTLASVTFQNYFRMYKKLSGMTGTADTEAVEFKKIYDLDVVVVPTNQPIQRLDHPDLIYKTEREKFNAIAADVAERSRNGQPSLVGTISIEKSEEISNMLKSKGISHNVLNAKYHQREAEIVAEAGRPGMVTLATNMAGRGTDIVLGGRKLFVDDLEEHEAVHDKEVWEKFEVLILSSDFEEADKLAESMSGQDKNKAQSIVRMGKEWYEHHIKVVNAGGLHIVGTERHEARRIDNQLRGRSGRQGDAGSSRFYLSLDDNLMRIFGSERIYAVMDRLGMQEGQEIESKMVSRAIASAQKRVEGRNFEIRKHLLEYDDVMNSQREYIYRSRNEILDGEDISEQISGYFFDVVSDSVEIYTSNSKHPDEWDLEGMNSHFRSKFAFDLNYENINPKKLSYNDFVEKITENMLSIYKRKESDVGADNVRNLERLISLQVIDAKWRDHLLAMDQMRDGIWTSGYGEKNPLLEYKLRGFEVFQDMISSLKKEIVELLMKVQIEEVIEEPTEHEYQHIGNEFHAEVGQFGAGAGIPVSADANAHKKPTQKEYSASGGVKRKKTRRSRRG